MLNNLLCAVQDIAWCRTAVWQLIWAAMLLLPLSGMVLLCCVYKHIVFVLNCTISLISAMITHLRLFLMAQQP